MILPSTTILWLCFAGLLAGMVDEDAEPLLTAVLAEAGGSSEA